MIIPRERTIRRTLKRETRGLSARRVVYRVKTTVPDEDGERFAVSTSGTIVFYLWKQRDNGPRLASFLAMARVPHPPPSRDNRGFHRIFDETLCRHILRYIRPLRAVPLNFYSATIGEYAKYPSSVHNLYVRYVHVRIAVVVDRSVNSYLNGGIVWRETTKSRNRERKKRERERG